MEIVLKRRNWMQRIGYSPKLFVRIYGIGSTHLSAYRRAYAAVLMTAAFIKGV